MYDESLQRQTRPRPRRRPPSYLERVASRQAGECPAATPQRLWLYVHLPQLPLDILSRGGAGHHACVLVSGQGRRQRVMLANSHAAALGVRNGMPPGAARVLGDLTVFTRDEYAEKHALRQLCAWAYQFTPVVSPVSPDGLLLEIGGSLKLFGGIRGVSQGLGRGLKKLGYRGCFFAVAPTPLAATALARAKKQIVTGAEKDLVGQLDDLPLDVMRWPATQCEMLHSMGVRTIGDCLRLPRGGLGRRLTPDIVNALDRLVGRAPDPRERFTLPQVFESRLELPWEADNAQALGHACERLLHELVGYLKACCAAARQLRWTLRCVDNNLMRLHIALTKPSRDHAHLALLLRERLTRSRLVAPVRGIELYVDDIAHDAPSATGQLFGRGPDSTAENWPAFVDRLRSRLGEHAVLGVDTVFDHRPENAWRYLDPAPVAGRPGQRDGTATSTKPLSPRRPLWLTRQPLPLGERGGIPEFDGPLHLIRDRERIEGGWWDGADVARDYFIATNPVGARLWVFRELAGDHAWYLHGIFE